MKTTDVHVKVNQPIGKIFYISNIIKVNVEKVILRAISTGESDLKDCVMYGIIIVLFFRTH